MAGLHTDIPLRYYLYHKREDDTSYEHQNSDHHRIRLENALITNLYNNGINWFIDVHVSIEPVPKRIGYPYYIAF